MKIKTIIFNITLLLYITYLIFPLFAGYFNFPTWLFPIVVSVIVFVLYPRLIVKNKTFYWFLLYCLITFVFMYFGRVLKLDIGTSHFMYQLIIEYAFFLPNILVTIVLLSIDDGLMYKRLSLITLSLLLVSFIVIIPQLNYTDLRSLALSDQNMAGVMGYTLLHAYVIILPVVFLGLIGCKKAIRILFLLLFVLLLYIIFKSSITTTILISVAIIPFFSGYRNKRALYITAILVAAIGGLLYYEGGLVAVLDWAEPYFEGTAVEQKIIDIKEGLLMDRMGGTVAGREDLHKISWNGFFSNILTGGNTFGGHSCLVDRLACMGLVGFIPYIMIYLTIINQWKQKIVKHKFRYFYYLCVAAAAIILYSKGLFGQEGNLFLMILLPMVVYYLQFDDKEVVASEIKI